MSRGKTKNCEFCKFCEFCEFCEFLQDDFLFIALLTGCKKEFIFLYRLSLAIRNRKSSFIMSIVEFDCRTYMVGQSSPRVYSLGLKIFSQNFSIL